MKQINTVSGYTVSQTSILISGHTETMGVSHPVSTLPHEHVSHAHDTILGCTVSQILVQISGHTETMGFNHPGSTQRMLRSVGLLRLQAEHRRLLLPLVLVVAWLQGMRGSGRPALFKLWLGS